MRKDIVKEFIYEKSCWTYLKSLQENKIVKSSYIWLFIVPLIAKLLSKIEKDILFFEVNDITYSVDLELSFSWIMLFISALLFVIGNLIYLFSAPELIKKYSNYGDFLSKGESFNTLINYNKIDIKHVNKEKSRLAKNKKNDNFIVSDHKEEILYEEDKRKNLFSDIYYHYNHIGIKKRVVCSISYFVGVLLFSIVLIQNIYWVFIQL